MFLTSQLPRHHSQLLFAALLVTLLVYASGDPHQLQASVNEEHKNRTKRFFEPAEPQPSNDLPMLHIGFVDIDQYPLCGDWLDEKILKCQRDYELLLREHIMRQYSIHEQIHRRRKEVQYNSRKQLLNEDNTVKASQTTEWKIPKFTVRRNSEHVKLVSCCGMWRARQCIIDAIERDRYFPQLKRTHQCPADLPELYRRLPVDPQTKSDVNDYCSEYQDGSLICSDYSGGASPTVGQSCFSLILVILASLILVTFFHG